TGDSAQVNVHEAVHSYLQVMGITITSGESKDVSYRNGLAAGYMNEAAAYTAEALAVLRKGTVWTGNDPVGRAAMNVAEAVDRLSWEHPGIIPMVPQPQWGALINTLMNDPRSRINE